MKKAAILLIVSASIAFVGCAAESGGTYPDSAKVERQSNKANADSSIQTAERSTNSPAAPNVSNANVVVPDAPQGPKNRKMEMLRGPLASQSGPVSPPQPMTQPAPDNSTYSVMLTDVVTETRTFRNHPQIIKVEKRSDGKQSTVKIFLKDGRVAELPGDKITALSTAPASELLAAAGLETKTAAAPQMKNKPKP